MIVARSMTDRNISGITATDLNADGCQRLAAAVALAAVEDIQKGRSVEPSLTFWAGPRGRMFLWAAGVDPDAAIEKLKR